MKKMIHCCFTSHQEVMFRCPDDVGAFINLLALTSWKYGVDIFADTEMSNHVHLLLFSADSNQLSDFICSLRKRYAWYFNQKYSRPKGERLGEKYFFSLVVEGNYHMISACS